MVSMLSRCVCARENSDPSRIKERKTEQQHQQRRQQCVTDIGDPPKRRLTTGFLLAYTWHSLIKQAKVANIKNKIHQYRAPVDTAWSPRGLGY